MEPSVRDQIVQSAYEVLSEVGPARLRVHEVAKRSGVSPTLLYYYFDGKNALIAAAYAASYRMLVEQDAALIEAAFSSSSSASEMIAKMSETFESSFSSERRKKRLAVLSAAQTDSLIADEIRPASRNLFLSLRGVLEKCQELGWIRENVNLDAQALLWISLPLGFVYQDLDDSIESGFADMLGAIFNFEVEPALNV